ncbi:MAG: hypothetical protein AAGN46_11200 [Acidobacteriota bacterium]
MKAMLPTRIVVVVLSIVKVSVDREPRGTVLGEKDFEKPGWSVVTSRLAVAGPAVTSEEVSMLEVLIAVPTVELVTSTEIVQVAPAATWPSAKVMLLPPAGAVSVPPQVEAARAGSPIVTPAGRASVNAKSVVGMPIVLVIVKMSRVVLPGPMSSGLKVFVKFGCAIVGAARRRVRKPKTRAVGRLRRMGIEESSNRRVRSAKRSDGKHRLSKCSGLKRREIHRNERLPNATTRP